jgi:hypothetical protein
VVLSKLLNSQITVQYPDNIDAISEEFFKKEIHPQWAVARRMEFASTRITVLQNNLKGQILSFVQSDNIILNAYRSVHILTIMAKLK